MGVNRKCQILLSFTSPQVCSNLYEFLQKNTKEDILKNVVDPIDFHSIFFLLWKSEGSINCHSSKYLPLCFNFQVKYSFNCHAVSNCNGTVFFSSYIY